MDEESFVIEMRHFALRPLSYYWKREIASTRPAK